MNKSNQNSCLACPRTILSFTIVAMMLVAIHPVKAQTAHIQGIYKLSEIIHQDGKRLEANFKQYKFCTDKYSLTIGYNPPAFGGHSFDFGISNPDGKPLAVTGELSKTENKGIQVFTTSDSTFTLRWFNDRSAFNEHLFPYQTNIDEEYELVNDSTNEMYQSLNLLQMKFGAKLHRLQGVWKLRGRQKTNTATSQYWIEKSPRDIYYIFGSHEAVVVFDGTNFPRTNLNCQYTPCKYLSDYAFEFDGQTSIVNWFDDETISITTIDYNGQPFVSVWDRQDLPRNIQEVFGAITTTITKKDVSRFYTESFEAKYGHQPDSVRFAFETFDYAINANEKNNAIFPVLMRCGFEDEYTAMKDSLMARLMRNEINVDEAVGRYVFWFYKNFDRHTNCSSRLFRQLEPEVHTDYCKLIPNYAPEPVGCKVDDETYLLRLPSCMGVVPTWEWLEKKAEEFKQSGCKYLILDLRGNNGGSDNYSLMFADFMCDSGAKRDMHYYYRASTENNRYLKSFLSNNNPDDFVNSVLADVSTKEEGSLTNWVTIEKGTHKFEPLVRKGALIIDNRTASAGESPVSQVRNFSTNRVKVYGRERSGGYEQTGNVNTIRLPHSDITLTYPVTVDDIFEQQCKERNPGYKPDVIIPLPYPKQLTDNIDEWVLWVAKKMKK